MTDHDPNDRNDQTDPLDTLLREWHAENRVRAEAGRDRLARALRAEPRSARRLPVVFASRFAHAAAVMLLVATAAVLLVPSGTPAQAQEIMVPNGGQLLARDEGGAVIGPCPLAHTDVDVSVAGHFTRVTVRQRYENPYERKIEAVYTFPLSHRAAVDRMTMTVGERVIVGSVRERGEARRIYEDARAQGYVAGLLEQERPNIFTQSVANIEAGVEILVEISYVETLQSRDGEYTLDFPMVVGPRYVPGRATRSPVLLPAELERGHGLVLLGPADLRVGAAGRVDELGTLQVARLRTLLDHAVSVRWPGPAWWGEGTPMPAMWHEFRAEYGDGTREAGRIFVDGTGEIGGRWFFTDPKLAAAGGTGFERDTDQVPDASRITPLPVRPDERAGHDISITVRLDSGGPAIVGPVSPSHGIATVERTRRADGGTRAIAVELERRRVIPNRDFVLSWRLADEGIREAHFTHSGEKGKFFTLVLEPPERIEPDTVPRRELIFVLDRSGSMRGFPIAKARAVMSRAIDAMRPGDTFNVITFAGHTQVLWERPRPSTEANRAEARRVVESQSGAGGTEMMTAITAALTPTPPGPASDDGDVGDHGDHGQAVAPMRIVMFLTDGFVGNDGPIIDAVRANAGTTRVFAFGIGNSVNRFLLDGIARAGRGEVEYVLLEDDADEAVERFATRIATPVLTDIDLDFGPGLEIDSTIPAAGAVPDLFDERPLIVHGRYTKPGRGRLTIRGRTGAGPYERTIDLELPADAPGHDVIATLWARARVDELSEDADREEIVALGERFGIVTKHTSFVAVERSRVTVGGEPMLVAVPVEMPDRVAWEGIFGGVPAQMQPPVTLGAVVHFEPSVQIQLQGQPMMRYLTNTATRVGVSGSTDGYDAWQPVTFFAGLEYKSLADRVVEVTGDTPVLGFEPSSATLQQAEEELLRAVLDKRLWRYVLGDDTVDPETGEAEPVAILVSLLATDTSDATIKLLKDAGFQIEDQVDALGHFVGRIVPGRLRELALLDVVRRVEPVDG